MPRPGITLPVVDYLAELPVAAVAGSCMCMDRRGPDFNPNIYILVPTAAGGIGACDFYALNVTTNSLIPLAKPGFTATSVIGVGTTMCFDESGQRVYLFNSQSNTAAGYEWCHLQYYSIAADTWTTRTVTTMNLAAPWAIDAAMVHTDLALSGTAVADCIFLIGHGSLNIYRHNQATNNWTILTGVGLARTGVPAVGATLTWNLDNTDTLYSHRGGGANTLDVYTISTDTWLSNMAYLPVASILPNTGSDYCECIPNLPSKARYYIGIGGRVYQWADDVAGQRYDAACQIEGTDGLAHVGRGMVAYTHAGIRYLVYRLHSGKTLQRIRLID